MVNALLVMPMQALPKGPRWTWQQNTFTFLSGGQPSPTRMDVCVFSCEWWRLGHWNSTPALVRSSPGCSGQARDIDDRDLEQGTGGAWCTGRYGSDFNASADPRGCDVGAVGEDPGLATFGGGAWGIASQMRTQCSHDAGSKACMNALIESYFVPYAALASKNHPMRTRSQDWFRACPPRGPM